MVEEDKVVESPEADITEQPPAEEEKTCMPCLLPGIMTAWATTRAACEFLPDQESKLKCRDQMEHMAKEIKDIKSAEDVLLQAIEASADPEGFIDASIQFAQRHNETNSAALIRWAENQEAQGNPISEKLQKIVRILRLEKGI